MNIDYARAYSKERMARAEAKRRRRDALLTYEDAGKRDALAHLRDAVGNRLISLGERLAGSQSPLPE